MYYLLAALGGGVVAGIIVYVCVMLYFARAWR